MDFKIPGVNMAMMAIAAVAGIIIPVALYIFLRKKKHADHMPFWIGCAVFIVFALILERLAYLGLSQLSGWSSLQGNLWLYAVVGGLMAGVFEETGRVAAFQTVLKKKRDKNANALMYGAGHGGIEAVILLSFTMISNLILSSMVNSGNTALLQAGGAAVTQAIQALSVTSPWLFLVGIVERIGAVSLHISLSVLVWFAVKNKKQWLLFPAAILIHAIVDAAAVILAGSGMNVLLIELAIYAMTGLSIWAAVAIWKKNKGMEAGLMQPSVPAEE